MSLHNMNIPLVFFDHQWSSTVSKAGALDRVFCAFLVSHGTHVVSEKYIQNIKSSPSLHPLDFPYCAELHNVT